MPLLAAVGWLGAALLGLRVLASRRRLEVAASAEHELRGPVAALSLGAEQVRRGRTGPELAGMLEAQLDRSRAALADLSAALDGARQAAPRRRVPLEQLARHTGAGWAAVAERSGRGLHVDWRAGPVTVTANPGRLAQALGNVLSNAVEHGGGEVNLRGRRVGGTVRIEVTDGGRLRGPSGQAQGGRPTHPDRGTPRRGRGLGIAARAVEESGGSLRVVPGRAGTMAVLELPLEDQ